MKKVLITGGAGFIGSHLVEKFLKNDYQVVVFDNLSTGKRKNLSSKAIFYQLDLENRDDLEKKIKQERPEVICHHASSLVGVQTSIAHPQKAFEDIFLTTSLFEVARENQVRHLIFASSANVYQNQKKSPLSEESRLEPLSPYGITKLAIESYCHYLEQAWGLKCTIFRYFNVYGPRQRLTKNAGIIPILINRGLKGKPVVIFGDGQQTRDFTYVEDIAQANFLAVKKRKSGLFNVGTGRGITINKLIAVIENLIGKKIKVRRVKPYQETKCSLAGNSKIKKTLGWQPETNLVEGLKKTISFYQRK